MRSYKLAPHVADVRLIVQADSLEELFTAALEGMNHLIKPDATGAVSEPIEVTLESADVTTLLIDFLSDVLTHTHINNVVYTQVKFKTISQKTVQAEVRGTSVDSFDEDIKAVTYHEAEVVQTADGHYTSTVIFDI